MNVLYPCEGSRQGQRSGRAGRNLSDSKILAGVLDEAYAHTPLSSILPPLWVLVKQVERNCY